MRKNATGRRPSAHMVNANGDAEERRINNCPPSGGLSPDFFYSLGFFVAVVQVKNTRI